LRSQILPSRQESFYVLALNAECSVTHELEVARGGLYHVDVHPREIFRPLIRHAAAAGIVAHNHPSGNHKPSADDVTLTNRLRAASDIIGIPIIDHVIMSGAGYTSLAHLLWTTATRWPYDPH